ncbi:hypothetical protein ABK040_008239 [Willaertia magna]
MKRSLGNDFARRLTNSSKNKQLKTSNTKLNWLDANTLSIVTSYLPLNSQLHLRLVSSNFNEFLLESLTILKILFDFKQYWNETISKDDNLFKVTIEEDTDEGLEETIKPYLQWIFGAQLRCNGIIKNYNILTKKNQSFNDNEIKLFKNGIIEITECINESGIRLSAVGSLCKLKWKINQKDENVKESITFIQHFIKGYNSREGHNDYRYVLGYYKDENDKEFECLIDVLYYRVETPQNLEEIIANTKTLEAIRTKYCNQLETNSLKDFLTFLMKCAKCERTVHSVMDGINKCYSKQETGSHPFPQTISENVKKGVNEMNLFLEKLNWKKSEYSIICNALQHLINLMKSIATNTDVKYSSDPPIRLPPGNVVAQLKKQLKCVSTPREETSAKFTIIEYCHETKEIGEAIFHLTKSDKLIRVKHILSFVSLYGGYVSQMVLFYKELNNNEPFKCFYVEGDLGELEEDNPIYTVEESVETIKEMFGLDKAQVNNKQFVYSLVFCCKLYRIKREEITTEEQLVNNNNEEEEDDDETGEQYDMNVDEITDHPLNRLKSTSDEQLTDEDRFLKSFLFNKKWIYNEEDKEQINKQLKELDEGDSKDEEFENLDIESQQINLDNFKKKEKEDKKNFQKELNKIPSKKVLEETEREKKDSRKKKQRKLRNEKMKQNLENLEKEGEEKREKIKKDILNLIIELKENIKGSGSPVDQLSIDLNNINDSFEKVEKQRVLTELLDFNFDEEDIDNLTEENDKLKFKIKKLFDDYYDTYYEDVSSTGDTFKYKYKTVERQDYGLSPEDILELDDKDLEQVVPIKLVNRYESVPLNKRDLKGIHARLLNVKGKSNLLSKKEQRLRMIFNLKQKMKKGTALPFRNKKQQASSDNTTTTSKETADNNTTNKADTSGNVKKRKRGTGGKKKNKIVKQE